MDTHPYLSLILQNLFPVIASLLCIVLFPLIRLVLQKIDAKYDLHLSAMANDQTDALLQKGIAFAEEWARNKVKIDASKIPSGAEKMDKAIKFVEDELKSIGVVDFVKDRLEAQLAALLNQSRPVTITASALGTLVPPTDPVVVEVKK